jgi:hypothetical protein
VVDKSSDNRLSVRAVRGNFLGKCLRDLDRGKKIQLGATIGEGDLTMIVDIFLVKLKSIFKCTFVLFITL